MTSLGLRDAVDRGAIRAAHPERGAWSVALSFITHILCAAAAALFLRHSVPAWMLAIWGGSVAVAAVAIILHRVAARGRACVDAAGGDIRKTAFDGIALGAVWAIAPLWFGPAAIEGDAIGLWIALAAVTTGSVIAMAMTPLATILFLILAGTATSLALALTISPALGIAAFTFALLLCSLCVSRARSTLLMQVQHAALAERDEIVSLLLHEAQDSGADWLWEVDAHRRIVRPAAPFASALGTHAQAIEGASLLQVLSGDRWHGSEADTALRLLVDKLKTREAFRNLLLPVTVAGEERWFELAAQPRIDERGVFIGFRGVGSDVTEAQQSSDRINRMARYDLLTGLPNRLLVNETLAQAMAEAEQWGGRCAFMMIDLDRFKAVNDSLGHPIGDRLLGRVSERLRALVTDNEIIGRLGGDEFAVVVRDGRDREKLERLAQTIIAVLSRPYDVDQHTLYIGASVGLAVGPRDGRTAEMLIRSADLALYQSKDAGGGVFHAYAPELHVQAEERRVLEIALRGALQNDELHLQFQPVVDADSGHLTGFEALLRWTHPELGSISPSKFVPLAEEARLIAPIGEWVVRHACAEAAQWDDDMRIAINVSAEQLHSPTFVAVVAQALAQSGVDPERLELEVTESVFLREGTGAVRALEQLLELGCRLSLDDFGTGYSSLGYLSRTRFSTIKIDRSFVQAAAAGGREAIAIIRAVVALAGSLGMATTAEGVETQEELAIIRALGCDKVQGFHFGRPLPIGDARTLATRRMRGESVAA